MDTYDVILKRRTIRKFQQKPVPKPLILKMLNAGRLSPTGMNIQPLRFYAVTDPVLLKKIFPYTRYAGYLPDGSCSPTIDEAPTAVILILVDQKLAKNDDITAGAAGMSIILTAQNEGVASCWMGAIDRKKICEICGIDMDNLVLHSIISLGYPAMTSMAVPMHDDGNLKYCFDENGVLNVPKRAIEDVTKIL